MSHLLPPRCDPAPNQRIRQFNYRSQYSFLSIICVLLTHSSSKVSIERSPNPSLTGCRTGRFPMGGEKGYRNDEVDDERVRRGTSHLIYSHLVTGVTTR